MINTQNILIYHNPVCSKSIQALALLQLHSDNIRIIEYLEARLSGNDMQNICQMLKIHPVDIIRKKEPVYQLLQQQFIGNSYEKQCQIIASNPILLERPIVIIGEQAIIAKPPEKLYTILTSLGKN